MLIAPRHRGCMLLSNFRSYVQRTRHQLIPFQAVAPAIDPPSNYFRLALQSAIIIIVNVKTRQADSPTPPNQAVREEQGCPSENEACV